MATVIMKEMGLSHTGFGFVFSVAMIGLILFRIPWGLIGDKIGYVDALRIALPISATSAIIRALSSSHISLLLSQFFLGLSLAAILPCLALLVKERSAETAGLSTGIYVSGFAVGNATALGLTPYLLERMAWRGVLLLYACIAVVVSGLWWGLARDTSKRISQFEFQNFKKVLRERHLWVLLLFMIASMGSYDTLATWMPKVLEMKGLNRALASLLALGFLLAGPTVGSALDKFRNRKAIVALLGALATASILGINYALPPLLLLCIFLSGFAIIGMLTISLVVPAEHERLSVSVGGTVGLISSLGNIGPLLMPVIFGLLIDLTNTFQASVLSVAILAGVTFILGSRLGD
jgi:cyanate permease